MTSRQCVEILEEIEAGDPVFDDAKAFALAIVQKHHVLEETNRELADALEVGVFWIEEQSRCLCEEGDAEPCARCAVLLPAREALRKAGRS